MSLVPYSSRDSREIVLRYDNTLVLRDPQSQQLILRARSSQNLSNQALSNQTLSECPYCHRPLPNSQRQSNESDEPEERDSFVSPEYFRLLRSRNSFDELDSNSNSNESTVPSSPIRRLVEPVAPPPGLDHAEFVASTPDTSKAGIRRDAFSPNYFERFFVEQRVLGSGGKGVVLLVRHVLDGVDLGHFACKRVPVGDDHEWLEKVFIEVQLLQGLSHPNLVSYRHSWLQDTQLSRFQPAIPCAFILQEYCNSGDLLHYLIGSEPNTSPLPKEELKERMRRRSKGQSENTSMKGVQRKLSFDEIFSLFRDITRGLAYLHAANYIHRDLKPSNCLLHKTDKGLRCLISDFGEVQSEHVVRKSTGATGTISYCAPEVLRKDASGRYGNFTTKSDIFSLGMILYFMCFRRLPYISAANISEEVEDVELLREEISQWEGFVQEKAERPELPEQYYEFMKKLLALDPAKRPSAAEIEKALLTNTGFGNGNSKSSRGSPDSLDIKKRITVVDSPASGTGTLTNGKRTTSSAYMEEVIESSDEEDNTTKAIQPSDSTKLTSILKHRSPTPPHPGPHPTTPLLMPPPLTTLSTIQHHLRLQNHHLRLWLSNPSNFQLVTTTTKIAVFLLKLAIMNLHCQPRMVRGRIFYALMGLAAVDLVGRGGWVRGVVAMGVHVGVVEILGWRGGLCGGGLGMGWD